MISDLAIWMPGSWELVVILAVGLLLFGGRLPEVGKSLGRSLVEFRKGLRGIRDEVGLGELDEIKRELQDATRPDLDDLYPETPEDGADPEAGAEGGDVPPDIRPAGDETAEDPHGAGSDAPRAGDPGGGDPPAFGYQR